MKILLDTHTFLWWVDGNPTLSAKALEVIRNPRHDCFLSMASCWEMAIKSSIGKLTLTMPVEPKFPSIITMPAQESGYQGH